MADMIKRDTVDYRDPTPFDNTKLNSLSDISKALRHKTYGEDTREAIAQQGEALAKLMQETGGNQSAEIVAARGKYETLGIREDAQDNAIVKAQSTADSKFDALGIREDAQDNAIAKVQSTADSKFDNTQAESYFKSITALPETFTNLDAIKAKYPGGKNGLMVASDNGHKYIWANNVWTDAGVYQSVGIADGSVDLTKISSKTVDILASQSQNYNETAISLGYKRFISFPVESGGIISTTGNDRDYPASIRSKQKINFEFNNLLFMIKDPNIRVRLFVYNQSGAFEYLTKWLSDKETYTVDTSKLYRFEINTVDETALSLEHGYSACKIVYQDEKISNFDMLEDKLDNINNTVSSRFDYEKVPANYGYNQFNNYKYEYGAINSSSGNDFPSSDSIRTLKNNLITFDSAVTVINLAASQYRIKFVAYNTDGSVFNAGLWWNAYKNTFDLDLSKQFRIQIATTDGSAIDLEKALQNIKIAYADNLVANLPRYWQKYLDKRISEVKPELSKGTDLSAMLITTDTHFVFNNVNEINPAVAEYICDKMGIGTLLHLGDTISENASKSIATERMNYVMSKYRYAADNFYPIRGNHDDNNEGGLYPYSICITQKESYSWMFRRNDPRVVMGETGTYYYVDNEFEKTRMIFLDAIDFPYADNGNNKIKEKYLAWGIKQLDWFANKALKVPEGYSIAIFNHTPIVESIVTKEHGISASRQSLPKNANQMIEILEAYVARSKKDITIDLSDVTSFEYFNGTVSVDFTQSTGKIVGWFCGHEHIDDIQDIGSTGIKNVIILNNSSNFGSQLISSTYQPERKMLDITEEVYDLLIIDKSSQKVTLERFGAGNSITRSFSY